MAGTLLGQSQT